MARHRLWLDVFLVALCAVALAGCGTGAKKTDEGGKGAGKDQAGQEDKGGGKAQPGAAAGYNSPQEVFAAAREASTKEDYQKFATLLTDESRDALAGMMVMAGSMTVMMAEQMAPAKAEAAKIKEKLQPLTKVLEQHQVGVDKLKEVAEKVMKAAGQKPKAAEFKKTLISMAEPVKDRGKFVADMMSALASLGGKGEGVSPYQEGDELKDVKITGDTATGQVVGSKGKSDPIAFRKTAQGWRIEIPDQAYEQMIQGGPPGGGGPPETGPELPPAPPPLPPPPPAPEKKGG